MSEANHEGSGERKKRTWRNHQSKDWIIVRLTRDVHDALCEARESMRTAEKNRKVPLDVDFRDRVSLNETIRQLLAFRDHHRERSQRAAARRKGKLPPNNATSGDAQGTDPASEPA